MPLVHCDKEHQPVRSPNHWKRSRNWKRWYNFGRAWTIQQGTHAWAKRMTGLRTPYRSKRHKRGGHVWG